MRLERLIGGLVEVVCAALLDAARPGGFLEVQSDQTVRWDCFAVAVPGLHRLPPPSRPCVSARATTAISACAIAIVLAGLKSDRGPVGVEKMHLVRFNVRGGRRGGEGGRAMERERAGTSIIVGGSSRLLFLKV